MTVDIVASTRVIESPGTHQVVHTVTATEQFQSFQTKPVNQRRRITRLAVYGSGGVFTLSHTSNAHARPELHGARG